MTDRLTATKVAPESEERGGGIDGPERMATPGRDQKRGRAISSASTALSNLRAVTILIVVAFHAVLAYLTFLPETAYPFDRAPYKWVAFPIIDSQRWIGSDVFCATVYPSMMALMFFLSGLFVAPSLARKGSWTFLSNRFLRIGLPLVAVVIVLMPLAYYPAYRLTAADPGLHAFWQHWLALPFWPSGPQWFLWLLLGMNVVVAVMYRFARGWSERLIRLVGSAGEDPVRFFAGLAAVSAVAYVPLSVVYSPWTWTNVGPVGFETTRPLFYLVYFVAGYALGARGLDRAMLACDGPLARRWALWLAATVLGFFAWALPSSMTLGEWSDVPLVTRFAAAAGLVVGCAAGCLFLLAVFLRFARRRNPWFDSLSANAYRIYLLHYVFIVWLQYALLDSDLPAVGKAALVFGGTLLATWTLAAVLGGVSLGSRPIRAKRVAPSA